MRLLPLFEAQFVIENRTDKDIINSYHTEVGHEIVRFKCLKCGIKEYRLSYHLNGCNVWEL